MKSLRTLRGAAAIGFAVAAVSACGQRGPLYLPEEAPVEVRQNPQATTTTAPVLTPAPSPAPQPPETDSADEDPARKPDTKPR